MSLTLIVLLPFIGAVLPAIMIRAGRNACATATGSVTLLALILLMAKAPAVIAGEVFQVSYSWLPELGLNVTFFLDGLGLLFATLILGIGLLIIIYARFYLSKDDPMGRFYVFLLLFQGAMVGIVLSDNILLLLIFWELTSLSSFLLIGYWKHLPAGRQGARMALAVTGAGGLAMIAGMLILGDIVGSYDLTVILQNADLIQASPMYLPALILILLGCFTKSAQFPFHFWLPHAMAAPTPVSAYLHSATMVKAGLFLMARMWPVLSGTEIWIVLVCSAGLITMVLGALIAIFKNDLKALLAFSTVSHLGLITFLLGTGTPFGAMAAVFHILNHASFKAALFMSAGIVDHAAATSQSQVAGQSQVFQARQSHLADSQSRGADQPGHLDHGDEDQAWPDEPAKTPANERFQEVTGQSCDSSHQCTSQQHQPGTTGGHPRSTRSQPAPQAATPGIGKPRRHKHQEHSGDQDRKTSDHRTENRIEGEVAEYFATTGNDASRVPGNPAAASGTDDPNPVDSICRLTYFSAPLVSITNLLSSQLPTSIVRIDLNLTMSTT